MDSKKFFEEVVTGSGLSAEEVRNLMESLTDSVVEAMLEGDSVAVPSFGTFEPRKKQERVVVHPSTGRKLLVPPKLSITFKPSAVLRQKINSPQIEEDNEQ